MRSGERQPERGRALGRAKAGGARRLASWAWATLRTGSVAVVLGLAALGCGQDHPQRAAADGTAGAAAGAPSAEPPAFEDQEFKAMGGMAIRIRAWGSPAGALGRALPRCQQLVETLEQQVSTFRESSLVSQLNRAAGKPLVADADSFELIERALGWSQRTRGAFDPTVGPLVELWRTAGRTGRWPLPEEIGAARARVGGTRIGLDRGSRSVTVAAGTELDLAAIAEGFAADRLASLLRAEGVRRARIDVGGELRLYDDRPHPEPFRIGIRHPLQDGMIAELRLGSGAVATSGCYEGHAQAGGRRICHVIDPRSGMPVERTLSATVVAAQCTDADALDTALLVLGPAEGIQLAESLPGINALIVAAPTEGAGAEVVMSAGLLPMVSLHATAPAPAGSGL